MTNSTTLKVVPSLSARRLPDGEILLTKKFLDGVNEFKRFWDGPLSVYLGHSPSEYQNMDDVAVSPKDLDFGIEILDQPGIASALSADQSAVVLLSLDDFRQNELGALCSRNRVSCVYVSEYSLATRIDIIRATTPNPLRRVRQRLWENGQESKRKRAVRGASGLQCNGAPTHDSYGDLNAHTLLYFDTRVTEDLLSSEQEVRDRLSDFETRPFRLLFSGRLDPMKGVAHLLNVAKALRNLSVDFEMLICGDGELKDQMARDIQSSNLAEFVSLTGVLDFRTDLVPLVRSKTDLFVCCHPQGDPSCTYLETMSCGVPIAGYANEAFAGVVRMSGSGWAVPVNDPLALAKCISEIKRSPEQLKEHSLRALSFAKEHTFEKTFSRRIDHLKGSVKGPVKGPVKASAKSSE